MSQVVRIPLTSEQKLWLKTLAAWNGVSEGEMIARAWEQYKQTFPATTLPCHDHR